jgi:hypothetical protein
LLVLFTSSLLAINTVSPNAPSLPQKLLSPAPITQFLPADIPLAVVVNTKTEKWQSLSKFELFSQIYSTVENTLPAQMGLNYQTDIKPWLGEQAAFAFMPQKEAKLVSLNDSFLLLVAVKDKQQLQAFIERFKEKSSQEITERQYKGVQILEWKPSTPDLPKDTPPSTLPLKTSKLPKSFIAAIPALPRLPVPKPDSIKNQGMAIALLPKYIVIASTAKPIEQLLDKPPGGANLAQNPNFKQTTQHPQYSQALFTLYQDPNKFLSLFKSLAPDPSLPFPIPLSAINTAQVEQYSSISSLVWEQPEGLRLQLNAYRKQPSLTKVLAPNTTQLLPRLPAPAYGATTGSNIYGQWQMLVTVLSSTPQFKDVLAQFNQSITSITKLDLNKDILGWMDGEYALFFYPTKQGLISRELNMGLGFFVQTTNRPKAESTLNKLGESIKAISSGALSTNTHDNINGFNINTWEIGEQSVFAHTWIDDKTLLISTGLGAITELLPQPQQQLAKDYNFATATSSLPFPNQGYSYINMGSSLSWIYSLAPTTFNNPNFQTFKQVIGSVRSYSTTTTTTSKKEQYDGLLVLAPAKK